MNLKRLAFSLLVSVALALLVYPAHAEIREATYEVQAWCFRHPDPIFTDALGGVVNKGAITNARPHMHMEWLIKDGVIQSRMDLIGKCAIIYSQWVKGYDGAMHQMAYIPKGHGGIEYTNGLSSPDEAIDNYFHGADQEQGAAMGCLDKGSTKAGRGNSQSDCD